MDNIIILLSLFGHENLKRNEQIKKKNWGPISEKKDQLDWLYPPMDWLNPLADWLSLPAEWLNPPAAWPNLCADEASPLEDKSSPPTDKASPYIYIFFSKVFCFVRKELITIRIRVKSTHSEIICWFTELSLKVRKDSLCKSCNYHASSET